MAAALMAQADAPIELQPWDAAWPQKFEAERARLQAVLAPWLAGPIEHIGSTAVAQMPAKPVIDIMAAVHSLDASRPALEALQDAGYVYAPYKTDAMHWFCKPSPQRRTHHLHLVPLRSDLWRERLAFRDALRADAELAARYAALKQTLANQFKNDREAYTNAKTPFIRLVLSQMGR